MDLNDLLRGRVARILGVTLTLLSFLYLIIKFSQIFRSLPAESFQSSSWLIVIFCALGYGFISFILAVAWHILLNSASDQRLPATRIYGSYGKTQIAKYAPGNVGHILWRHFDTRRLGIDHSVLGRTAISEIVGLLSASSIISALWIFSTPSALSFRPDPGASDQWQSVILLLALFTFFYFLTARYFRSLVVNAFFRTLFLYLSFFVFSGTLFYFILAIYASPSLALWWLSVGAFSIGWFTGFITPGSPGGLGVREATILFVLSSFISEAPAITAALLMRIVTIAGDSIFFLISSTFSMRLKRSG